MWAMEGVKVETWRQILMNLYRRNLAKEKQCTIKQLRKEKVPQRFTKGSIYKAIAWVEAGRSYKVAARAKIAKIESTAGDGGEAEDGKKNQG